MNKHLLVKKFFLLLVLALAGSQGNAQVLTISGTGTSNSYLYSPMYSISAAPRLMKMANHYPAVQLASMASGSVITSIDYERGPGSNAMVGAPNLKLYLINLPASSLDNGSGTLTWSTLIAGATLVFDGDPTSIAGTSPGWKNFPFGTGAGALSSFTYTGGALVVYSEWTQTTAQTSTIGWVYQTAATATPTTGWTSNSTKYTVSSSATAPTTIGSSTANHPNTQFNYLSTPCSTPPVGGTATSNASTPICQGGTFTASLTGATVGLGATYQWESSAAIGGPYTPVGLPSNSYTNSFTATSTLYYRCQVTCNSLFDYSIPVLVTVTPQLSGSYTINSNIPTGTGNYASFTDAITDLGCGVSGPVVFNVAAGSGPYNEQVTILPIIGASATNTITFNGNGATLTYGGGVSATPHTLALNGADYITFNNLNIEATGATYSLAAHLWAGADNNTFSQCTFTCPANGTATTHVPFSISGVATTGTGVGVGGNNNVITDCNMVNGYYGATITGGTTTSNGTGNQMVNCSVKDYYLYGIYLSNQNGVLVKNNTIERPNRTTLTTATNAGIGMIVLCSNSLIDGNRIRNPIGGAPTSTALAYGIYSTISPTAGNENRYYNNVIYDMNGFGTRAGIYITGNYAKIYHNTISFDETGTYGLGTTTYGIWLTNATAAGLDVQNNIISITRGGLGQKQCLAYTSLSGITSNNNNLFMFSKVGTNYYGLVGTTGYSTLTAWKAANGSAWDALSKNEDPLFTNPSAGDFTPLEWTLSNAGATLAVTTDILGTSRGTPPDLGAYEFTPPPCVTPPSAGTASIFPTVASCSAGPVWLSLAGQSTGAGQTVQWESFNTATSAWVPVPGATQTSAIITPAGSALYRASVTCGSNTQTSNTFNITVNSPLAAGTYTINDALPTGSGNFQSFSDAAANLGCGITGPVVFNVVSGSGPYNEQVELGEIVGTSSTNTITINGNGATLSFNAPTISDVHTLMLSGTDYVTINDLIITNSGNTYGIACHLWNDADNNTFNNCTFIASLTTTVATVAAFSISGAPHQANAQGVSGNNNIISGCTMIGGYYSVNLVGASGNLNTGNQIVNCTMKDWYTTGPYMYYQDGAIIRGNIIERPTRTVVTTTYGIYVLTGCTNSLIEKNRIRGLFDAVPTSTSTCYGIYSSADASGAGFENKYYNNIISDLKGNGVQAGIYLTGATFAKIYHNTIVLDYTLAAATAATYGIYSSGASGIAGADINNNIVYLTRGGTGVKYCIYLANLNTSNNNDLFILPNGTINNVGYFGADFLSLANWQTANGGIYDLQSKDFNPLFVNPGANDFTPAEWQIDNMGVNVGVTTDITGAARAAIPDVGAIEFSIPACTTPPVAGISSVSPTFMCAGGSVNLAVTGHSTGTGTTLQWQYYDNASSTWLPIAGATASTYNVPAVSTTTQYRAAVTCSGNTTYSVPSQVNIVPVFVSAGSYTLNSALPTGGTNFQSIQALDSALLCGLSGALTVNVNAAGTYSGQLHLKNIGSAAAPIIINGNGATFTYSPINDLDRACIKMDNADYVTVNNLNIVSPVGSMYGFGIHMINDADNNTVSNCTISCDVLVTAGTHCGVAISGSHNAANAAGSNCDNNTVSGCTINGGVYGVSCWGDGLTTPVFNNQILNNTILNSYNVPIYMCGNSGSLIQGNDISRPDRISSGNSYGIYLQNGNISVLVNANKVHNMFDAFNGSANTQLSFAIAGPGSPGYPNTFSNNITYNINNTRGVQYGLYNNGTSFVNYYYNTIVFDWQSNTPSAVLTAGLYQTGAATNIDIKNNIFKITRGGTNVRAGMYFNTPTTAFTSDYNDIYVNSGGGTDMIGYLGGAYYPLSAWQAVTGTPDMNSKEVDPQFTLVMSGQLQPTSALVNNQGTVLTTITDITGATRSATPDMGAYEFTPPACAPALSFTSANITTTTADISWTAPAGTTGYEYVLATTTTPPAGAGLTVTPATKSLTGLTPATRYYFFVRSNCGGPGFSPWSIYSFTTRPVNDDCANAISITSQLPVNGTTVGGTETQVPGPCVTTTVYANDVWYSFTLTQVSDVTLNVTNTIGDLVMETHSGTCGNFTSMDCQDSPAVGTEVSTFNSLAAGTYYVRVYGFLSVEAPFVIQAFITPLSIDLLDISATNIGSHNRVSWSTAKEDKGDYFILERSADGRDFSPLATLQAKGEATQYNYNDVSAFSGVNYYRLKLMDPSGKYSYSKVVSATVKNGALSVKAFPNPVTDKLKVVVYGKQGSKAAITVSDLSGKMIYRITDVGSETSLDMEGFAPGVYMVRYADEFQNRVMKVSKH